MSKKVIIVHGWDGHPEKSWFPWLKKELETRGFEVIVPQLPQPEEPRINNWVSTLSAAVGSPDENTYLVGHSMGCQTIARYLQSLSEGTLIGGAVYVAGFFKRLTNLEDDEVVQDVAKEWLETPVDLIKAKEHCPKSVAIFSDDDEYVPLDNRDQFENQLGSKIIIEHEKGHFNEDRGIKELPVVLDAVLELVG